MRQHLPAHVCPGDGLATFRAAKQAEAGEAATQDGHWPCSLHHCLPLQPPAWDSPKPLAHGAVAFTASSPQGLLLSCLNCTTTDGGNRLQGCLSACPDSETRCLPHGLATKRCQGAQALQAGAPRCCGAWHSVHHVDHQHQPHSRKRQARCS